MIFQVISLAAYSQIGAVENLDAVNRLIPVEKTYLSLDKEIYVPGESLYYKLYLVDGEDHSASELSSIAYVELLFQGEIIQEHSLRVDDGIANGQMLLSDTLLPGSYQIRGYTSYQLNYGNQFIFTRSIDIKRQLSLNSSIKGDLTEHDLQLLPEGGQLLEGISNTLAFKCVNKEGIGLPIAVNLLEDADTVATTKSHFKGMGKLTFTPRKGKRYRVSYSLLGEAFSKEMPEIQTLGYRLSIQIRKKTVRIFVASNNSELNLEDSFITIQMRGKVLTTLIPDEGSTSMSYQVPYELFEKGVVQVTFFKNGIPLLERLYFNQNESKDIAVISKLEQEGQKANLMLDLIGDSIDLEGNANVAVAIADVHSADMSIESYLLLTSELRGIVENPDYYLNADDDERAFNLDLLMLTNGWRKYNWDDFGRSVPEEKIEPEEGLTIKGRTKNINYGQKESVNIDMYVMGNFDFKHSIRSDKDGYFELRDLDIRDSVTLVLQPVISKKKKGTEIQVVDNTISFEILERSKPLGNQDSFLKNGNPISDYNTYTFDVSDQENVRLLEEVVIAAKREKDDPFKREGMLYGRPTNRLILDSIPGSLNYSSVKALIQARVTSVRFGQDEASNTELLIRGGPALLQLNGSIVDPNILESLNVGQIEFIDVLKGPQALIYGFPALLAIYTKQGAVSSIPKKLGGSKLIQHPGYHIAKEFYTPKFQEIRANPLTTIVWNPNVTFENGKAVFEVPVLENENYFIKLEGLTKDGIPFSLKTSERLTK